MRKSILFFALMFSFTFVVCAQNSGTITAPQGGQVKIKITIGSREFTAAMTDNAAARDFISLLPLTLTLEDYNNTEKISSLPKKLSTTGAPSGYDPQIGDICLYAPWGNLCIFYRDFSYSSGLVLLGKIDSDINSDIIIDAFNVSSSLIAKFEVMK